MNKKLDLIEILKDCPKGTEFYSRCLGVVKFESINDALKCIILKNQKETVYYKETGVYYYADENAEIDLFPSKDQRDWSKWHRPFKDGDIVYLDFGYYYKITIFKRQYREFLYYHASLMDNNILSVKTGNSDIICTSYLKEIRFATEEEKQKLFQVIKDNGYKWNTETNTLEKLIIPKFKIGNNIQSKTDNNDKFTITDIDNGFYYGSGKGHEFIIPLVKQDNWELIPYKFDPKTLNHFDKVLVRQYDLSAWCVDFFSYYDKEGGYAVCTGESHYDFCVPYNDDTKHLVSEIVDAPEFYRYWEK